MADRRVFDATTDFEISAQACDWTVRAMSALRARLALHIRMHRETGQLEEGEIFLFNHFARFETFIPSYIIHEETGSHCRSVASGEFFTEDNAFSRYLLSVGAVPNNYERLLPYLAEEILKGRKVVVFPEGGMVKDRRVVDAQGDFAIYSRTALEHRKHHAGAAVLALTLDAFKTGILENYKAGRIGQLERWKAKLGLESIDALLAAVRRPTMVMPSNITFYPLRVSENILTRGAELFSGGLSPQLLEELLVEGNLLLKETDMDIRIGEGIHTGKTWSWMERKLLAFAVRHIRSLDDLFGAAENWRQRIINVTIRNRVDPMRDAYMRDMYNGLTVNLSHLASSLVYMLLDDHGTEVDRTAFHKTLYLAVKRIQSESDVHLHGGLVNPEGYEGLLGDDAPPLEQFVSSNERQNLIARENNTYKFLPKLLEEHDFDEIRMENTIEVYANELGPVVNARRAVDNALEQAPTMSAQDVARLRFDDECRSLDWDRSAFSKNKHRDINDQETASANSAPYLSIPEDGGNGLAVVLVHGFLASPAELRDFGDRIAAAGHPVIGVRLKGHGTSPHDLQTRHWEEWLASVRRGYDIIAPFAEKICVVGFSTGGALSLILAAEQPEKLAGVAVASTPLRFRNKNLAFVPLLHGANKLMGLAPAGDDLLAFTKNDSEHPDINYRHIPIKGLYELRQGVAFMNSVLGDVTCPAVVIQGDNDTVVDPRSADLIFRKLGSTDKATHWVESTRHGIINENTGGAQDAMMDFISRLRESEAAQHPREALYPWEAAYTGIGQWHTVLPKKPLYTIFDDAAARFSHRPCIDFMGRAYEYGEVADLINRAAEGFRQIGVEKGVRVGLCLPNTPFSIICFFAILKAGGTVVNVNPLYAKEEVAHMVQDSGMEIVVTVDVKRLFSKIKPMLGHGHLRDVVVCGMRSALPTVKGLLFSLMKAKEISTMPDDERFLPFGNLLDNDGLTELPDIDPEHDVAVLQYTGGTTGAPKGAMLTHANLSANTEQVRRLYKEVETGRERVLVVLPLFHAFAMTAAMNYGIATGAELILLPRFDLEETLKAIETLKPTLFPGVPALFAAIGAHPDIAERDLSSIKVCISGGAPLPAAAKTSFEEMTGCQMVEGYGLSEASPVVACNPVGGIVKPGSVGIPLPRTIIEIRDLDAPDKQMPIGEIGEICIDGPQVMAGYWRRPEETVQALDFGVLHTGDMGYLDEDGFVFLVDREKDMILNGGYNVYPRVVEEAIHQFPDVVEVAVIGVSHALQGEVPKAFVTMKEGVSEDAAALKEFLSHKLSPMELPRDIEFRKELPKTLIGKISKKDLVEEEEARRT
jgi:acyl-CoA synthetase (AMP-forming)/AMP-acid ligase II/esterase/lipase